MVGEELDEPHDAEGSDNEGDSVVNIESMERENDVNDTPVKHATRISLLSDASDPGLCENCLPISNQDLTFEIEIEPDADDEVFDKPEVYPVPIAALMPLDWDILGSRGEPRLDIAEYFFRWADWDQPNNPDPAWDETLVVGNPPDQSYYEEVADIINAGIAGLPVPGAVVQLPIGADLPLSATKFLATTFTYWDTYVHERQEKDVLATAVEAVYLRMAMPFLMSDEGITRLSELFDGDIGVATSNYLREIGLIPPFAEPLAYRLDSVVTFESGRWRELFHQVPIPFSNSQPLPPKDAYLDIPIDPLIAEFNAQNHLFYELRSQQLFDENNSQWEFLSEGLIPTGLTYRLWLPGIRSILAEYWSSSHSWLLEEIDSIPLLPYFEEIDLRPIYWQREAASLALERALANEKIKQLGSKIVQGESELTELDSRALTAQIREANRSRFEIERRINELRDEVEETGYTVLERPAREEGQVLPEIELILGRVRRVVSFTKVLRSAWIRQVYYIRRTIRLGLFLRIRRRVRRTRRVFRTWYEVRKKVTSVDELLPVEWRPVEEYLDRTLDSDSIVVRNIDGSPDTARTDQIRVELESAIGKALTATINGDKNVVKFEQVDGQYLSEHGRTIDQELSELRSESDRLRTLFLIAIYEPNFEGRDQIVKYIAVHNPIASRKSDVVPAVYLVETHNVSVSHDTGHYLGPLSHTVTLFPGEARRVRIRAESRFSSTKKQDQRETQSSTTETKTDVKHQLKESIRTNKKESRAANWSVKASGGINLGIGKIGGSAGGGGTSSSSKEQNTEKVQNTVAQAIDATSTANEIQFQTTSEESIAELSETDQLVEFKNVNEGRSVTHKFFQVLNRFVIAQRIKDAKLVVEYDEPVIPGIDLLQVEVLPLDENVINQRLFKDLEESTAERLRNEVIRSIREWYGVDQLPPDYNQFAADPQQYFTNSGSYYVDTEVAHGEATEPYAERARNAEVAVTNARAQRIRREANAISRTSPIVAPGDVDKLDLDVTFKET